MKKEDGYLDLGPPPGRVSAGARCGPMAGRDGLSGRPAGEVFGTRVIEPQGAPGEVRGGLQGLPSRVGEAPSLLPTADARRKRLPAAQLGHPIPTTLEKRAQLGAKQ